MIPALDLVELARTRLGQPYRLGARADLQSAAYAGPWDCAELASWAVYQITRQYFGCSNGDPYSGAWAEQGRLTPGAEVSPEVATATVGAVLVRAPQVGHVGHVAISQGSGRTIEAYDTAHGVIESSAIGRRWDLGVLVPGLTYDVRPPIALAQPRTLRIGSTGSLVSAVQSALRVAVDGSYGPITARAVAAFQASHHLVPDGEVGPITLRALGL